MQGRVAVLFPDDLPRIADRAVVLRRQDLDVGDELKESIVADALHNPVDEDWCRPGDSVPGFCGQNQA